MSRSTSRKPVLPDSVEVGHTTFSVTADPEGCRGHGALGVTFCDERRIILDTDMPLDTQRDSLLHEVLHACVYAACGLGLSDATEERVVKGLTGPLLSSLRRNPELLAFLLS